MFVAGLNVLKSLTGEDLEKVLDISDKIKKDEAVKKIKTEQAKVDDFFKLETEEKIKAKKDDPAVKFVLDIVKEEASVDVSKKAEDPFKTIIERIQKDKESEKEILTKTISKYDANIVQIVVCNVKTLA